MTFENITYDMILARMLERVPKRMDKREGSIIWDTNAAAAIELQLLYLALDEVVRESFGDTASREYLIRRAKERGISPRLATKARLRGEFTPASLDLTGRRFNIGALNYVVVERLAPGDFVLECESPGVQGNLYFGALTPVDYVDGLQSAELTELLIPGEDEEETEALRRRYLDSFAEKAFGGNVQDYLQKTQALPGVGAVKVERVWNGDIRPAELVPNEQVRAWYESVLPNLNEGVQAWLTSVYTAATDNLLTVGGTVRLVIMAADNMPPVDALLQSVQTAIDPEQNAGEGLGLAPIGHVVKVQGVEAVPVSVVCRLTFADGFSWDRLQEPLASAVEDYLLELRRAWGETDSLTVRISHIENRLLQVTGVLDVEQTSVNGGSANLTLGKYQIPVLEEVTPWSET